MFCNKERVETLGANWWGDVVFFWGRTGKEGRGRTCNGAKPSDTLISSFKLLFVQATFYFKKCLVRINRAKLSAYQFLLDGATGYDGRGELLVV